MIVLTLTVIAALFFLYQMNKMTFALSEVREFSDEQRDKVFRTVNILMLILMISFYVDVYFVI